MDKSLGCHLVSINGYKKLHIDLLFLAHGGSVIVLSNAAVRRRFISKTETAKQVVRRWSEYTQNLTSGDEILAMALNEVNVNLSSHLSFQGNEIPHVIINADTACRPLAALHHMTNDQMSVMYELEGKLESFAQYIDLFARLAQGSQQSRENWDYAYYEGAGTRKEWERELDNSEDCRRACYEWPACKSWSYEQETRSCIAVSQIVVGQEKPGTTSGIHVDIKEWKRKCITGDY